MTHYLRALEMIENEESNNIKEYFFSVIPKLNDQDYKNNPGLRSCIIAEKISYENNIDFNSPVNWKSNNYSQAKFWLQNNKNNLKKIIEIILSQKDYSLDFYKDFFKIMLKINEKKIFE